jgi:hypothetical protein
MFHQGTRTVGGNAPPEVEANVGHVLDEFAKQVAAHVQQAGLRRAIVRSMLVCNIVNIIDRAHLFVVAQKSLGMPTTLRVYQPDAEFSLEDVLTAARWDFGFDAPFAIQFPIELLDSTSPGWSEAIGAVVAEHVRSELTRVEREMNIVQLNPVFGPASYAVDPRLAFVLMPFTESLTEIYTAFIKPTVEDATFGLVCRRADDIKSNKAIIQDIWKSICEARLILADLSGFNANVMYELGIAHTVGKETILIYQRGENLKFPFDLAHIRRIEYANDAMGGKKLVEELKGTLKAILRPKTITG